VIYCVCSSLPSNWLPLGLYSVVIYERAGVLKTEKIVLIRD